MQVEPYTRREYVEAFRELALRIAAALVAAPAAVLPIRMYVAGGAALHFHTGERVSVDVDAVFSRRIALPDGLDVAYRDADGTARLLYFDRQYNDTLGLLHESAYDDSLPLSLPGVDARRLDVRVLTPLDLAVSKLAHYTTQERDDVLSLARRGLLAPEALEARAAEALAGYVGDVGRVRGAIADAVRRVREVAGAMHR